MHLFLELYYILCIFFEKDFLNRIDIQDIKDFDKRESLSYIMLHSMSKITIQKKRL